MLTNVEFFHEFFSQTHKVGKFAAFIFNLHQLMLVSENQDVYEDYI